MARKQRFYVVWRGRKPGIFTSWLETEAQVKGFSGARHKSFISLAEGEAALANGPPEASMPRGDDAGDMHMRNLREQTERRGAIMGRQDDLPF